MRVCGFKFKVGRDVQVGVDLPGRSQYTRGPEPFVKGARAWATTSEQQGRKSIRRRRTVAK